jgi:hypothetical protein
MLDDGTIVVLFVYFLTTLALPVYMWRRHREQFSAPVALWSRPSERSPSSSH